MTQGPPMHPCLVIARNEAIHRRLHKNLDCHGAARLAMTQWGRHCTPASSLHPCLVIERNYAIHQRLHKNLYCHGAARRAMTDGPPLHPISPRRKLLAAEGRASHQQGEPPYICLRLHDSCHCHSGCSLGLNRRSHDQIHPLPRRPTSELAAILEQLLDCSAGAAASPQRPQHRGWAQCSRSNGP